MPEEKSANGSVGKIAAWIWLPAAFWTLPKMRWLALRLRAAPLQLEGPGKVIAVEQPGRKASHATRSGRHESKTALGGW